MCDDLHATVRELAGKGATFAGEVQNARFGLLTQLVLPSGAASACTSRAPVAARHHFVTLS